MGPRPASRICVVGEGMVELVRDGGDWRPGWGGDAVNIAVHLARCGHDVALATALGIDPFSGTLKKAWREEGVDDGLILTDPRRQVGLYAVSTDEAGERNFTYWRRDSAARQMFGLQDSARIIEALAACDMLIFSLITLAILPAKGRAVLLKCAADVRMRGGRVVFDGNFRRRLWPSLAAARRMRQAALAVCDIGLPTLEDEVALGAESSDGIATAWTQGGVGEVIVKMGSDGCRLPSGQVLPPPVQLTPVDTSGAGDAFDAGYLDARIRGASEQDAALAGHRLAGWVILQPGACPPLRHNAPYEHLQS